MASDSDLVGMWMSLTEDEKHEVLTEYAFNAQVWEPTTLELDVMHPRDSVVATLAAVGA